MFKKQNQKGFTLVEVIVVAVIVAVLAAVAVPLYNGYINDSQQNVAQNLAGTVASALAACVQQSVDPAAYAPPAVDANNLLTLCDANGENTIQIPAGYTVTINADDVAVESPRGRTSTDVPFRTAVVVP